MISYYSCWFIYPWRSELVEGNDVDGLDVVLERLNSLLDDISGDLVILDNGSHDELEDTVSNGLLLVLSLPDETLHGDTEDHSGELVEVSLLTPWLDFPKEDGLGDGGGLLLLVLGLGLFGLDGSSSGGISLGILSEGVEFFLLGGGGGGSGNRLLLFLLASLLLSL